MGSYVHLSNCMVIYWNQCTNSVCSHDTHYNICKNQSFLCTNSAIQNNNNTPKKETFLSFPHKIMIKDQQKQK